MVPWKKIKQVIHGNSHIELTGKHHETSLIFAQHLPFRQIALVEAQSRLDGGAQLPWSDPVRLHRGIEHDWTIEKGDFIWLLLIWLSDVVRTCWLCDLNWFNAIYLVQHGEIWRTETEPPWFNTACGCFSSMVCRCFTSQTRNTKLNHHESPSVSQNWVPWFPFIVRIQK